MKRLVKEGADPNGCDQHGNTSFHWCCMSDNCPVEVLSFLVSSSSTSVSLSKIKNNNGSTPMHLAFSSGNLELIRYIYKTDTSSMIECDYNDKMPVHYTTQNTEILSFVISVLESSNIEVYKRIKIAAWCCICVLESFLKVRGSFSTLQRLTEMMTFRLFLRKFEKDEDKEFVKFIIRIKKLQFKDVWTSPILHEVVKQGDVAIVTHFVDKIGCSINTGDKDDSTSLHVACYNNHFEIVKLLTNHEECHIEASDHNGRSALHIAAQRGHLRIVKYLVEIKQCDTNMKDISLNTALHLACLNGHLNVVTYLSAPQTGANIEERQCEGCYTGHLDVVEYLSNNALCDVLAKDKKGNVALHSASAAGHLEVVKHLIERKGCDINVRNDNSETPLHLACSNVRSEEDGNTPLHYACSKKGSTSLDNASNINLIKFLVSQPDCNIDEVNKDGEHVLHILCKYDSDPNIIKYLISEKQCSANVFDSHGNHPLHLACKALNIEHVIALTSSPNCDVDVINHLNGQHPLHILCETKSNDIAVEIAEHLIKKKQCDINVCNENGYAPLGLACKACNLEMVKLLTDETRCNINKGIHPLHIIYQDRRWKAGLDSLMNKPSCDVNVQDSDGNTLLHLACKRGDTSMVKQLISHPKCDINILNKNNENPLLLATRLIRITNIDVDNRITEIVELLVKTNKCDVNIHGIDGNTALHYLCKHSSVYGIKLFKLLAASLVCDINAENNEGERPIHVAVTHHNHRILEHLVNCGCKVNVRDLHGNTPLHQACRLNWHSLRLVKLLTCTPLCDVNAENNKGVRPIHLAAKHGSKYLEVVRHLVNCGCDVAATDKQGRNPVDYSKKSTKVNKFLNRVLYKSELYFI